MLGICRDKTNTLGMRISEINDSHLLRMFVGEDARRESGLNNSCAAHHYIEYCQVTGWIQRVIRNLQNLYRIE